MKNNKNHTKLSDSGENIWKPLKIEVVGIFPTNSKKNKKRRGEGKLHIYCLLHYIQYNWWWIVSFIRRWIYNFFEVKIIDLFANVEK